MRTGLAGRAWSGADGALRQSLEWGSEGFVCESRSIGKLQGVR